MLTQNALFIVKNDLRLHDNYLLEHALKLSKLGFKCCFVYFYNPGNLDLKYKKAELPDFNEFRSMGAASLAYLDKSLKSFAVDLETYGIKLDIVLTQNRNHYIESLISRNLIQELVWVRSYEPFFIKDDTELKALAKELKIKVSSFRADNLLEPWEVKNKTGGIYKVYTPFSKQVLSLLDSTHSKCVELRYYAYDDLKNIHSVSLVDIDEQLVAYSKSSHEEVINTSLDKQNYIISALDYSFQYKLDESDWDIRIFSYYNVGETAALTNLDDFISTNKVNDYHEKRDFPDIDGTSSLSQALHFGEISPRLIYAKLYENKQALPYIKQLIWRDFAHHLLYHFPSMVSSPLRDEFLKFPWQENNEFLKAWQLGQTGYPIVDAAMRQLWTTGWMHNRLRMVVGSFLVKHLLLNWQYGAKWFWDTLIDANLANNTMGWQWIAGCGADAAPYFRIFNPLLQSSKFDPDGNFIKKWVPELARLPKKWIHAPFDAPQDILDLARIRLGETYPKPIVDHKIAREKALKAFDFIKS